MMQTDDLATPAHDDSAAVQADTPNHYYNNNDDNTLDEETATCQSPVTFVTYDEPEDEFETFMRRVLDTTVDGPCRGVPESICSTASHLEEKLDLLGVSVYHKTIQRKRSIYSFASRF